MTDSGPNWPQGKVPTPAEWEAEWESKQDALSFPLAVALGGTGSVSTETALVTATGSTAARSLSDRFADVRHLEDFAPNLDGVNDDAPAVLRAAAALGTKGGVIAWRGNLLVDTNLTLPAGVSLVGGCASPGQYLAATYDFNHFASTLTVNPAATITFTNSNKVSNCFVVAKGLSLPFANSGAAATGVAAFAGVPFTAASPRCTDPRLEDLLVLGFAGVFLAPPSVSGTNRPQFRHVYFDINGGTGFDLSNVFDLGSAVECHAWEFATTNQAGLTTDSLLQRTGTAFAVKAGADWFKLDRCFAYGWRTGFDISANDVQLVNCGVDDDVNAAGQNNTGYYWHGAIHGGLMLGCQAAAKLNAGIIIDTGSDAVDASVRVVGCSGWGNTEDVRVVSGNALIQAGRWRNAVFISINATAGAGLTSVVDNVFANCTNAIGGDATAISARMTRSGNQFVNVTNPLVGGGPGFQFLQSANFAGGLSFPNFAAGGGTSRSVGGQTATAQTESVGAAGALSVVRNSADGSPAHVVIGKSRAAAVGGNTAVVSGDNLGAIDFAGADGTTINPVAARIAGQAQGTVSTNVVPGLLFIQTANAAGALTTAVTIDNTQAVVLGANAKIVGNVGFFNTSPVARPTVSGAKGGNAALGSLMTALAALGLVTDTTTA